MRHHFAKLAKVLSKAFSEEEVEVVRRAYRRANEAHAGVMRASGEPYILHPLKVAYILAQLGLDPVVCAAALLHDVLEDTPTRREDLEKEFGGEIATLVDGVTKIGGLTFREEGVSREVKQAQNIRKMLVTTAKKDVRVLLIKLADRLHNMRTIEFLRPDKQRRIAQETQDIYAPLAHRLGIERWKWELEDHAFHVLQPEEYKDMARQVSIKRREREACLVETIAFLEKELEKAGVAARVIGRPKHLYSIYRKMMVQGKDFAAVMDILGVRIITGTDTGCYHALGVVHSLWTPVPGRLKDYIAMPRSNGYQAIHTTLMRENGLPMEVQIRSEEMDRIANEGITAHWVYKEGGANNDARMEGQFQWLRQMYEWLKDAATPDELMDSMRREIVESHIYVFTPKGEVKELPTGATPLDFAYLIHSDVGNHCFGARANGRMVPLRYHLQNGDVLEILTSKNQVPHRDWLDTVVTGRARTRIRQRLREMGELEAMPEPEAKPDKPVHVHHPHRVRPVPVQVRQVDDATRQQMILIQGTKGMRVQFGRCCNPMPGMPVVGYVTKNPGITIHRTDCRSYQNTARDPSRVVDASWDGEGGVSECHMRVVLRRRPNMLADLTSALRPMNLELLNANLTSEEEGKSYFDFAFHVSDQKSIRMVEQVLKNVPGVLRVTPAGPQHPAEERHAK